jgi:hypothetical protein
LTSSSSAAPASLPECKEETSMKSEIEIKME